MKMPIAWHKECLNNSILHYNREIESLAAQYRRLIISKASNETYGMQIIRAFNRKKDGFDRDKFMQPNVQRHMMAAEEGATRIISNFINSNK